MDDSPQQTLSPAESRAFWPTITLTAELSGATWRPLDASTAAQLLKSSRKPDVYSSAHPIIESIRAVATCPPGTSGPAIRSWRSWMLVECRCGTIYPQQQADLRKAITRKQALYCTPRCMATTFAAVNRTNFCDCGEPIPRSRKVTCSTVCEQARRARTHRMIACPQCGVMFRPKSHRTQFCGKMCADLAHSRRMIGAGNSHFKTGTSYAKWFRSMRPMILERDGGICVVCQQAPTTTYVRNGATATRSGLVIHHINELPWDNRAENLITLCHDCHMTHHKSRVTPFGWFGKAAESRSRSMTSKWKARATSLLKAYSSTTA